MDEADGPSESKQAEGGWVVGVDGSECSRHAARWAARQAEGRAADLTVATAWSLPASFAMSPVGAVGMGSTCDAFEDAAHAVVDQLAGELASQCAVPVSTRVGHGGAAPFLLDVARERSMLVVGSRGRGGFARLVLGSTSTQCATHATVPVAIIPANASVEPPHHITVAFDGSAHAVEALRWANDFAPGGAVIDCVSVWDTTPIAIGSDQFFFPEASDLAEQRFEHLVMRTIHPIRRDDLDVRHVFVNGRPRNALAELASASDLLVVGARGHGAIGAALLGSVSTWLLHHVERPIVVVPKLSDEGSDVGPDVLDIASVEREE